MTMRNKVKTVFVSDDFNALVSCISDLKFYPLKKNKIVIVAAVYRESKRLLGLLAEEFELKDKVEQNEVYTRLSFSNVAIEAHSLGDGQKFRGLKYDYLVICNPVNFTPKLLKEVLKND